MTQVDIQDAIEQEDTLKGKFLIFTMGSEMYGLEIQHVIEIIGLQPMTEVPELPEHIKGIINLRGRIIPVMDVRLRFKKPFKEYNDRTCIIVIDISDLYIGLIVDRVLEVISISENQIVEPPKLSRTGNRYIKGIAKMGEEIKLLLDSYKLLTESEIENLNDSVLERNEEE